ncbi:hypothetical protein EZH22_23315 [Xanthobacter dioxanivorans]|uniref:Uncharacterized protein n=1 Tax=Xanthobacter dioxanivorans TaxID=2528964 RepID=A0A974SJ13_9HYPH|nr:hypothetical protein [Xanthobacter dioxanivorans]QRG05918.1 hypothetical protein EZH22_23315 [Xanthobacter dioxanivorans]
MANPINRRRLMRRAWHLFRTQLDGPGCILRNNPREAFRAALRMAWQEAKAAAAVAAMPAPERAARIAGLKEAIANLEFVDSPRAAERLAAEFGATLRALEAGGGRPAYLAKRQGAGFALKRDGAVFARLTTTTGGAIRLDAPAPLAARVRFIPGEPLAAALAKIRAADEAIRAGATA